jgi:PKD repeat protein
MMHCSDMRLFSLQAIALAVGLFAAPFADAQAYRQAATAPSASQDQAADRAGVSRAEFRNIAKRDRGLKIDAGNSALYICEGAVPASVGTDNSAYTGTAPFPLDQTFRLHSRPGAKLVIYLDFDGHTTSGTSWNSSFTGGADFTTPAFDTDANPASFSTAEQTLIQNVWRRVAEDFAPFDVDVTTEDPGVEALRRLGTGDVNWGVRMVIGGSSSQWLGSAAGGVAYVGSFNWSSDTPAYVFPLQLSNNEKYIAEAASHEAGHTVGLNHMGQTNGTEYYAGHADWAPIMGVGYYKSVVQWTKGDYPLSNNTRDEVSAIRSFIPRAALDHGTSASTAISVADASISGGGLLSDRTDTAWYALQAGPGALNVTGTVASLSPNLKLSLSLVDSTGLTLATSPVGGSMGATLSTSVTGGTYYLVVNGVGTGDALTAYTDYGSLGRFSLSGSWAASGVTNQPPVASTLGTSPTSGTAPLTVSFVGTNSSDPDGIIAGYLWNFGDGTTSTLGNVSHTYAAAGTYTATLTVTDNSGAIASSTVVITAAAAPVVTKTASVGSIALSWLSSGKTSVYAQGKIVVVDSAGRALPGAIVTVSLSGLASGTVTATADRKGVATVNSPRFPASTKGTITYTVTNVTLSGYTYTPTANKVTSASLTR